ncbi:Inosose dehydratase [Actinoalloteichus hoggarensis]|uniref:Inosose dehydratase n=2 Tax=Actinoalloteichus hoggarensis TaxID=1470176 RepID=A0A221WAD5_9PSEU|nr:Inosose dehydratase [Actinoalloteichus hoggarensis]
MTHDGSLSRRSMLRGAAGAALGLGAVVALGGTAAASTTADAASATTALGRLRVPKDAISIQLYTLRSLLEEDTEGTLRELAAIGYRKVELAGTYGRTAAEFRALLDRYGLRATSSHSGIDGDFAATLEDARTLGQQYLSVPYADFETAQEWRDFARRLDAAGEQARRVGIQFGYHNHAHEFQAVQGRQRPMDIITRQARSWNVHLELDLFWVIDAEVDPISYVWKNFGRVKQFHVKDRAEDGTWADLGTGTVDFGRIFRKTWLTGVREYVVEHDDPADPLETARVGYRYLTDLRF